MMMIYFLPPNSPKHDWHQGGTVNYDDEGDNDDNDFNDDDDDDDDYDDVYSKNIF